MLARRRLVPPAPLVRVLGALLIGSPLKRTARSRSQDKTLAVGLRIHRRVSRNLKLWYKLSIHCRQILAGPFQLTWVSLLPRPLLHSVTMKKGWTTFMPPAYNRLSQTI